MTPQMVFTTMGAAELNVKALSFGSMFEEVRLLHDYERIRDVVGWLAGARGDEVWDALPLVSRDGTMDDDSIRYWQWSGKDFERFRSTPVLDLCPYFRSIIQFFKCATERVRLMRMPAGGRILPHRDAPGKLRFHVPIVTHPDVVFRVEGERVRMLPGELWFIDLGREHEVANPSQVSRVHLVLDILPNVWLRTFMSQATLRVY